MGKRRLNFLSVLLVGVASWFMQVGMLERDQIMAAIRLMGKHVILAFA